MVIENTANVRTLDTGVRAFQVIVPGRPVPQGSKRAIVSRGKAYLIEDQQARHSTYRGDIRDLASGVWGDKEPMTGPLSVALTFWFERPKSHYRTGKFGHLLREKFPKRMVQKPDVDKLVRSVLDALTGIVIHDDALVCEITAFKVWSNKNRTEIVVLEDRG